MPNEQPIPSEAYDRDYFLEECEGHEAFLSSPGVALPPRLAEAIKLAEPLEGRQILDLGCGRGELERYCAERGASIIGADYSEDALALAHSILPERGAALIRSNVQQIPFATESFDMVFAFDLVEHLYPAELQTMYAEIWRVLKPGGRLIVHTMPNIWYYRYAYPVYRLVQRLRGVKLPRDPRDRHRRVHVNEQSLTTLRHDLGQAGFTAHVYLHNTQTFEREPNPWVRKLYLGLATLYPFKWIFCSDLFALATKTDA